jgi:hypothetical protein
MTLRSASALVLLAAGLLYVGVALPLQRRSATTAEEYRRLREDRRAASEKLSLLERRERARSRAVGARPLRAGATTDATSLLRLSVVDALRGAPVSNVRLSVRPGRAPVGATVSLTVEGAFHEVLRLSSRLAGPAGSTVLSRIRMTPLPTGVAMDLEGLSLRGRP